MTNDMFEMIAHMLSNDSRVRHTGVTYVAIGALLTITLCGSSLRAQAPSSVTGVPSSPVSLTEAVRLAVANYPSVQEQRARARAAEEGVSVARTAYLPRLEALWQESRATHNNVF